MRDDRKEESVRRRGRSQARLAMALLLVMGVLAACTSTTTPSTTQAPAAPDTTATPPAPGETTTEAPAGPGLPDHLVAAKEGPYKVGLANSFAGNSFRQQMVAEFEYAAGLSDLVSEIAITNSDNDITQQSADIDDLVAAGVDLILVYPGSETALDPAIQRAHAAGVQVVSFSGLVSSPHAINVAASNADFGRLGAEWLVEQMGGTGKIFALNGVEGSPTNIARWDAASEVFENAGIEVVGAVNTDWDKAKGRTAAADLLAAHPDVTGIYSQGGAVTVGAIEALQTAGLDLVPIPGEGLNEFLMLWQQLYVEQGWESIAPAYPPSIVVTALEVGLSALQGNDPTPRPPIPLDIIEQGNLAEYVRPESSPGLWLPSSLPAEIVDELYG